MTTLSCSSAHVAEKRKAEDPSTTTTKKAKTGSMDTGDEILDNSEMSEVDEGDDPAEHLAELEGLSKVDTSVCLVVLILSSLLTVLRNAHQGSGQRTNDMPTSTLHSRRSLLLMG
jgi:hypothetical protein